MQDVWLITLTVAIAGALFAALFWAFWFFGEYLPTRRFRPLKEKFGFVEGVARTDPTGEKKRRDVLRGEWLNHEIQIQYHPQARNPRTPALSICVFHRADGVPEITFHHESAGYRLAKAVHLAREAQSGDAAFDREVYVESDNDELLQPILASADLRENVRKLLQISKSTVELGARHARVYIIGHFGWSKCFAPKMVEEILNRLAAISKSAEAHHPPPAAAREPRDLLGLDGHTFAQRMALLRSPTRAAVFLAALSAFIGPALCFWGTRYQSLSWRLQLIGLSFGASCLIVYLPLLFKLARGRSTSTHTFGVFLFAALIGFPSFWMGGLSVANGLFDMSQPYFVEGHLVAKHSYVPNRSNTRRYRLTVEIVRGEKFEAVKIPTTAEVYQTMQNGQTVPVRLQRGALGEPWVVRGTLVRLPKKSP